MIEMRWVDRKVPMPMTYRTESGEEKEIPGAEPEDFQWVRFLQYRQMRTVTEWHGKAGGFRRQEWGDWQDVPFGEPQE